MDLPNNNNLRAQEPFQASSDGGGRGAAAGSAAQQQRPNPPQLHSQPMQYRGNTVGQPNTFPPNPAYSSFPYRRSVSRGMVPPTQCYRYNPRQYNRYARPEQPSGYHFFDSLLYSVETMSSLTNLLDNICMGLDGSFRALLDVVSHMTELRSQFARVMSAFTVMKAVKSLYRRVLRMMGVMRTDEEAWATLTSQRQAGGDDTDGRGGRGGVLTKVAVAMLLWAIPTLLFRIVQIVRDGAFAQQEEEEEEEEDSDGDASSGQYNQNTSNKHVNYRHQYARAPLNNNSYPVNYGNNYPVNYGNSYPSNYGNTYPSHDSFNGDPYGNNDGTYRNNTAPYANVGPYRTTDQANQYAHQQQHQQQQQWQLQQQEVRRRRQHQQQQQQQQQQQLLHKQKLQQQQKQQHRTMNTRNTPTNNDSNTNVNNINNTESTSNNDMNSTTNTDVNSITNANSTSDINGTGDKDKKTDAEDSTI